MTSRAIAYMHTQPPPSLLEAHFALSPSLIRTSSLPSSQCVLSHIHTHPPPIPQVHVPHFSFLSRIHTPTPLSDLASFPWFTFLTLPCSQIRTPLGEGSRLDECWGAFLSDQPLLLTSLLPHGIQVTQSSFLTRPRNPFFSRNTSLQLFPSFQLISSPSSRPCETSRDRPFPHLSSCSHHPLLLAHISMQPFPPPQLPALSPSSYSVTNLMTHICSQSSRTLFSFDCYGS